MVETIAPSGQEGARCKLAGTSRAVQYSGAWVLLLIRFIMAFLLITF
jgi:hypothetical protein